jgi:hypothetical protein
MTAAPLDPVADPAYPGITEATAADLADEQPQPGWDTDPALAPTQRAAHDDVLEPEDAWAALCAHDEAAGR